MTFLRKITSKLNQFKIAEAVKKILMIVSLLLIGDILIAVLGGPFLSENVGTFLGKSTATILSDLLFLEGAVAFAAGAFLTIALSYRPPTESTDAAAQPRKKRIHPSILLIIIGAILIGLSITVGTLFV